MKVEKVNSTYRRQNTDQKQRPNVERYPMNRSGEISFKKGPSNISSNVTKRFWLMLRQMGKAMKDITEIKNAFIAAIGTGVIAPAIILVSPGKGDKDDKDKKALQALRQPLSAGLQLGFQVPATVLINRYIDSLGYEKNIDLFKDDVIGNLIPTEKYLERDVSKEEIAALDAKFEEIINGQSLRQKLENEIKYDYEQVELEISDEKLAKKVKKKKKKFLRKEIAKAKYEKLKNEKISEILHNPSKYPNLADIKDIDLVSEGELNRVEKEFKAELKQMEKDANLSFFDKTMRMLGFETKKTKELKTIQENFQKAEGLKMLKTEKPEIFANKVNKIKHYIETYQKKAQEVFVSKKFGISLFVNLFMIAVSCFALNWIHPRVNKMIEDYRAEKNANNLKVEVR